MDSLWDIASIDIPLKPEVSCYQGDVWQLGRHKLFCLDATEPDTIQQVFGSLTPQMIWADPPYGTAVQKDNGRIGDGVSTVSRPYPRVIGDTTTKTAIQSYLLCSYAFPDALQIWWGANHYAHALPSSSCWIVWDKENTGDFADCELAWCSHKSAVRIFRHLWNGAIRATENHIRRIHPMQKPVALVRWAFEKYGKPHDLIYDPFLGSGSSIIAAEGTGRTVYGCELSPEYCAVIIDRWKRETKQEALLVQHIKGNEEVA